ncbi:MAG: Ig-like domain-containing protein [Lachnospiraceae bacterium]|nr:Ig-like domain-containing protein [Lachnospiraceae bacterium]
METEKIIVQSESDGEITFSSSDDRIATIDETGVLTALSVGEVTITATWGETDYYEATSNSVTLTVELAEITGCAVSLSEIP